VNLYFGYSQFDQEYWNDKIKTLEVKLAFKNGYDKMILGMFNKNTPYVNLWGGGLDLSYMIWKFLLEGRIAQYFVEEGSVIESINIPETKINAGLYFKDLVFNSNLDLKAGFVLNYTGKQNLRNFSVPFVGILDADIESWLTLDFTLSAEIQKLAIVYFTWENLFDWNYYITPYYPMLERNIRFGIAWEIFN
jgi:outer membrane receptor protein involved in Fe transport